MMTVAAITPASVLLVSLCLHEGCCEDARQGNVLPEVHSHARQRVITAKCCCKVRTDFLSGAAFGALRGGHGAFVSISYRAIATFGKISPIIKALRRLSSTRCVCG